MKITDKTPKIYLSRRNLLTLLSKLDRDSRGEETACAILKYKNPGVPYQQTMDTVMVIAVQDDDYYSAQQRGAGDVHPDDVVNFPKMESTLKEWDPTKYN